MKTVTAFVLLTTLLGVFVSKSLPKAEEPSINLKFVASANGKSYFADNGPMTWFQAKIYCNSLNMRLATITSQQQSDALGGAYHPEDFHGVYWTSGRDSQELRQFSWDLTNKTLSPTYLKYGWRNMPFQTCIYWHSFPAEEKSSYISIQICSASHGVLCETIEIE